MHFVYRFYSVDRQFVYHGHWFPSEIEFVICVIFLANHASQNLQLKLCISKFTTVEKVELMLPSVLNSFSHDCEPYSHDKNYTLSQIYMLLAIVTPGNVH